MYTQTTYFGVTVENTQYLVRNKLRSFRPPRKEPLDGYLCTCSSLVTSGTLFYIEWYTYCIFIIASRGFYLFRLLL